MRLSIFSLATALAIFATSTLSLVAQDGETGKPSPLGVRQKRVERMMDQLEKKFQSLSEALYEKEPERAERLKKALQESQKMLIAKRMTSLTELLNEANLDTATDEQQLVMEDLRALLRLLLDEENEAANEFDRLQELKTRLQDALREQRGHKRQSEKIARPEETLKDIDAQIAALEKLINDQQNLIDKTAKSSISDNEKIADEQQKVREQTDNLAKKIAAAGDPNAGEGKPGEGKPGEGKPGEGKPGEGKPGEGKPGEGKPGEGKPGEGKPGEGKPGKGKPGEGKPGEGKPGEGGSKNEKPPESGQKPLEEAVARQKSAEVKLAEGKKADAKNDQKKALDKMKEALEELKKERRRVASLPPEEFERLARNQKRTSAKTAKIGDDMKKSESDDGKPSPGQEQVKKAQQAMEQASSDLENEDPEGAEKKQDEAIKQLEKALQEIEERLAQLREETQAEKLARLEARFKEMLIRQEEATIATALLHKKRETDGDLGRTDRIAVAKLAAEERELAEMAFQAYEILVEDGTSVVFPHITEGIRQDLELAAEMLEAKRTDRNTQAIQQEIEESLRELIEALQKAQGQKKEGGGGGGGGGKQPLLPNSAELKLLRAEQMRINRRTKRFDRSRPDEGELDDYLTKEVKSIAARQEDIAILTEKIVERMRMQAAGL